MKKKLLSAALLLVGLTLSGCSGGTNNSSNIVVPPFVITTPSSAPPVTRAQPNFNPAAGSLSDIPFPNDLLRNPATGQNAVPPPSPNPGPVPAFDSISGFSTAGTVAIPFLGAVDPNTVTPQTVLTVDITNPSSPVPANMAVSLGSDGNGNSIINLSPVVPLKPQHEYIVIVTAGVKTAGDDANLAPNPILLLTQMGTPLEIDGQSLVPGLSNSEAEALEPVRQFMQPVWTAASTISQEQIASIPEAFVFGTQPLFSTLTALAANAQDTPPTPIVETPMATLSPPPPFTAPTGNPPFPTGTPLVVANPITTANVQSFVNTVAPNYIGTSGSNIPTQAIGSIMFGSYTDPNYQNPPQSGDTPPGFFQPQNGTSLPQQAGTNTINYIVCLPVTTHPVPCIYFQHGLTRTKYDVLLIANTLCSEGFGVIAIDAAMHGDRSLAGEPSGTGLVNLEELRDTRDTLRQTVSDQDQVIAMVASGHSNFVGSGNVFLTAGPAYLGQSLGGIIGGITTATNSNIPTSVLNVPGGRWVDLILGSAEFGGLVTDGLQQAGLQPGSPAFNQFLYFLQTVWDDADPYNYAPHLGLTAPTVVNSSELARVSETGSDLVANGRDLIDSPSASVLMEEMQDDQAVPNIGTADLALAANISQVNALFQISSPANSTTPITLNQVTISDTQAAVGSGLYQFTGGSHGFLLGPSTGDPTGVLTGAGQTQVVTFLATALENDGVGAIVTVPQNPSERVESTTTVPGFDFLNSPSSMFVFPH